MPVFTVPVYEANDCHLPAGTPQGGQFCSKGGGITYKSAGEQAAAEGKIQRADPAAFRSAVQANTRADTLSDYSEADLATFTLRILEGGKAGYAIKSNGELVNVFNNGGRATAGAGKWLVLDAVAHGARTLDHFDGFLTGFYQNLGWKETNREANWTPGGPDVVYRAWAGGDPRTAKERYRRAGRLDPG